MSSPDWQQIKTDLADQGVRYALASFVDLHGMAKAKAVVHLSYRVDETSRAAGCTWLIRDRKSHFVQAEEEVA